MKYSKDLPSYTRGEERFSAISHIAGGGLAIAGFVVGLVLACIYSDLYGIFSMLAFGISMIIMYTMSAIYHFLHVNRAKKIFRIFDHCSIFFLIAGTYTPYCLITLREVNPLVGWLLFSIVSSSHPKSILMFIVISSTSTSIDSMLNSFVIESIASQYCLSMTFFSSSSFQIGLNLLTASSVTIETTSKHFTKLITQPPITLWLIGLNRGM